MNAIMSEQISRYLDSLARDECYRVDAVLKKSAFETTERVWFKGENGSEQGPFIRKRFQDDSGLGSAYGILHEAHVQGRRFMHIPCVLDCYQAGEQRVVIMEYVGGETLTDVVYRCDPSLALATDLFPRICDALIELHEGFSPPLIHRDLKPSNVIVSASGVFLIDFGIAREYKTDAESDTCHFGTRGFAPPEQFGYGQTDVRSDVYALGLLLFFCLTERMPDATARGASFADARVPEAIRRIIERAAAFDPAARYATVRELKEEFQQAASAVAATSVPSAVAASSAPRVVPPAHLDVVAVVRNALTRGSEILRKPVSKVPFAAGVVWDVLLLLTFLLFAAASVSVAVAPDPNEPIASETLAYRIVGSASLLFFVFAPVIYALRDRRPISRVFPKLPQFTRGIDALLVVAGFIALVVVMCVLEMTGV
ncbi:serine/threonine-protein kinase [Adlercreutzia sp. ZJ138]|uniref:serine/threonine protein kinase n=1 Tax=Adlercreutzia sp. ZJ138 TaxID=2709405 RepID=UPI0013ECE148|nr:serine/threonine-protein kinase [Adlercreutzia sp. ZJ138]